MIQKNPPCDVALLDIMLPGMDGFSLCETIRHGDPYIGIIMASAKGQAIAVPSQQHKEWIKEFQAEEQNSGMGPDSMPLSL